MPRLNRRRMLGGAFQGAADALGPFITNMLAEKRAEADDARQAEQQTTLQGIDTAQSMLPGVMSGSIKPGNVPAGLLSNINMTPADAVRMAPQNDTRPSIESLMKAKTQADVPSFESMIADTASRGAGIRDLGPLNQLGRLRGQRLEDIGSAQEGEMDRQFATSRGTAYNTGLGREDAAAATAPAELQRKLEETNTVGGATNKLKLDLDTAETPLLIRRVGGEAAARQAAEWSPNIVAKKLDFEARKHIGELAMVGDKIQAEEVAKRNSAVKGLLPIYSDYRTLAVDVVNSWAGAASPTAGSATNALSKVPVIGELLASSIEAGHAGVINIASPKLAQKIAKLNKLTDTLAQGMANAVIGNKGQTTENDRRTAKNILVSSFTDAKTASDLLTITDRMFTLLPVVAGQVLEQKPFATPAEILTELGKQAQAAPPEAGAAPDVLASGRAKFQGR